MFKKFTPKGIFATCFLFGLFAVCVWNFPIHNYDYENEIYYSNYIFPPKYTQDYIDMETKYLLSRMAGKKDKDYLELLYSEIFALQSDAKSRLKYQQEYLSIDMEHNPDIVYSIITDYLIQGKYNEALNIANNTKLAKDSCYKKSKTLGEVAYCRANIHYIKFIKAWYANEISCHITQSACYDTRVYQQYKEYNDYSLNRRYLREHASDENYVQNLRKSRVAF